MRLKIYRDIESFFSDTYDLLMQHEVRNSLILGNLLTGHKGSDKTAWRDPANWFMAAVSDETGIKLTALMTPPYNITLYATGDRYDEGTLLCLIRGIDAAGIFIPGVMAEKILAEDFTALYTDYKGIKSSVYKSIRLYELVKMNQEISLAGSIRLAKDSDLAFLPYWLEGFNSECFGASALVKADSQQYQYEIDTEKFYVLEDRGTPVTIAKITREIESLCCISYVYTPPYFRRKGYGTSCVAVLSSLCLERGFARCVLYTDLANPTSNSIYQKIGYTPICDSLELKFDYN